MDIQFTKVVVCVFLWGALANAGATMFFTNDQISLAKYGVTPEINKLDSSGIGLAAKEDYRGALAKFQQSLKLNPRNPRALANRGYCFMNLGDLDSAFQDFEKTRALAPDFALPLSENYAELAYRYTVKQDPEKCIKAATAAIRVNSKLANAYANRGSCYSALSKLRESLLDLNRSIELNPQLAPAYLNRAGVHAAMGDCGNAKKDADRAIKLNSALGDAAPRMLQSCH